VWFEPGGPSRAASWWRGDLVFAQPWRLSLKALAALWRRTGPARSGVRLLPMSESWLQQYETEAAKHREDA
jgi:hypothetical protein